jgi:transposase
MDGRELRQYERWKEQVQVLRWENQHLRLELMSARPALYHAGNRIAKLKDRVEKLEAENAAFRQRLKDLTAQIKAQPEDCPEPPKLVKANIETKERKRPGRKPGHPAALRPEPSRVDVHQPVVFPVDKTAHYSCPQCKAQLAQIRRHQRVVEDLVPAKIVTTCYHTISGYCPCCRRRMESRDADQPPPADLPHAQLGLNALATAAVMRIQYRMPLRQISSLLKELPGLRVCPGTISKQLKRLSRWLGGEYDELKRRLRASNVLNADETSWRINGKNGHLWTVTGPKHTLYHIARTRKGKVIRKLLGKGFAAGGGTLITDFYSGYNRVGGSQQKCLVHLLRGLRDTITKRPELSSHAFFTRCKTLVQEMLELKRRRDELAPSSYRRKVREYEKQLEELSQTHWNDPDADRLSTRLVKYQSQLTTFLHRPEVDGTNNAAERALRPAVVMRKITGGSRSAGGARAWAILASIMRTAQQQGHNVLEVIKNLLRGVWSGQPPPAQV